MCLRPSPVPSPPARSRHAALLACGAALLALAGCARGVRDAFRSNLPPVVRLTHAPVASDSRESYAYRMYWVGYDPDGAVDHYLYAVDPANPDAPDSSWQRTALHEQVFHFRSTTPDEPLDPRRPTSSDIHTFAIRAVDDDGAHSETVARTFFSFTAAPIVTIQSPRPSTDEVVLTPSVRIRWAGIDPDGITGKPVRYRYQLFTKRHPDRPLEQDFVKWATDPANLAEFRRMYEPNFGPGPDCPHCAPWDSSPGDTTEARFTGLIPQESYLFVVTGFDDAGAYDPVWSVTKNMLKFVVGYAGQRGPVLTMYNEYFSYRYLVGGYINDPSRYVQIEVPADQLLTFYWEATPSTGADMKRYRWVLDLEDLDDETERTAPDDWRHWSPWSLNTTSAAVGPFTHHGDVHTLFIEAEDTNNLVSLGAVQFTVIRSPLDRELLFVNDTRFTPDRFNGPNLIPPVGPWPTLAELDTAFYARGGYPWRYYPPGTVTRPGVFAGYGFDTLSTRRFTTGVVPLSLLGRYRTVVWFVDQGSVSYTNQPTDSRFPTTSLRHMSEPGRSNTLAIYLRQGGRVWMFGGGAGLATIAPWGPGPTYTDPETNPNDGEIVPGRFLYEFLHWRNGMLVATSSQARMVAGEFGGNGPSRGWRGEPDYAKLRMALVAATSPPTTVPILQPRSRSDPADAPPPLRFANADWYQTAALTEVIHVPTYIREDLNGPAPGGVASTLDTLFVSLGGSAGLLRPTMTYYHGLDYPSAHPPPAAPQPLAQVVFSGFPLWYFRRAQQIVLADFVLQDIFGHERQPLPRVASPVPARLASARATSPARTPATPGRPDPNRRE